MAEEYAVIDLEMTGLRSTKDRIIEMAAVLIRDGRIAESFDRLVNPHRLLKERIIELTGITDAMTAAAPDIEEVLPEFLDFIGERTLVGHNLMADFSFVKQNAVNLSLSFEREGIDTLKIARRVLPEEQGKALDELCTFYGIDPGHVHRACDDARATAEVFLRLCEAFGQTRPELFEAKPLQYKAKKQGPLTPVQKRDLIRLTQLYGIRADIEIDSLTKSEASRLIQRIHDTYGRLPREEHLQEQEAGGGSKAKRLPEQEAGGESKAPAGAGSRTGK